MSENGHSAESAELLKAKITTETARINWLELQKFHAAGTVIAVELVLDLIDVAYAFSQDQTTQVNDWLTKGIVAKVTDAQAQDWFNARAELWAVVISPWILVQDKPLSSSLN